MGALKGRGLPRRLSAMPARIARRDAGSASGGDGVARRSRDWLNTAKWRRVRLEILERDGFRCQQTGVVLDGKYPAPNSAVVDHVEPHRGDEDLFWDKDNMQAVCKSWHDSEKQRREKRGEA